jgi:hypothetical protein
LEEKKPGINYEALRCALRPFANDSTIKKDENVVKVIMCGIKQFSFLGEVF